VYEVLIERTAERDLRSLSSPLFLRVIPHIRALAENPRPAGCHKLVGSKNDWRIRIGDYRVIYEIDDRQKLVKVFRVRHRREVYR
jgi:mRNA interferase RelE/StbE